MKWFKVVLISLILIAIPLSQVRAKDNEITFEEVVEPTFRFINNSEDEPQATMFLSAEGHYVLVINDKEILKITPDGDFYVEGRLTANDKEVYQKFKEWLDYISEMIK